MSSMTRDEAMLKLLAIEPERRDLLVLVTGWGIEETKATIKRLHSAGKITYWNGQQGQWWRLAPTTDQAQQA